MKLEDFAGAPVIRYSDDNFEKFDSFPKTEIPTEEILVAAKRFVDKVDMRLDFWHFPTVWVPETRTLVQGEYAIDGGVIVWDAAYIIPEGHSLISYLEKNL